NTPVTPGEKVDLFDLAIRRVALHGGQVYYNDRQTPLEAELRDVQAEITHRIASEAFDGVLEYKDGRIELADFRPLQHSMRARFVALPSGISLDRIELVSGSSRINANGSVKGYSNPTIDGSYQAVLSGGELAALLNVPSVPSGELNAAGTIQY